MQADFSKLKWVEWPWERSHGSRSLAQGIYKVRLGTQKIKAGSVVYWQGRQCDQQDRAKIPFPTPNYQASSKETEEKKPVARFLREKNEFSVLACLNKFKRIRRNVQVLAYPKSYQRTSTLHSVSQKKTSLEGLSIISVTIRWFQQRDNWEKWHLV